MKKKIFTSILNLVLTAALLLTDIMLLLPINVAATSAKVAAVSNSVSYFRNYDRFVISPAEEWNSAGVRTTVYADSWEVNVENNGIINGNQIHMWKTGTDNVFRACLLDNNTFRIQYTNADGTKDGRYWDVNGRSTKADAKIHVWSGRTSKENDDSQRFFLVEDNDGDKDTYYIKNVNSDKYLAPQDYFDSDSSSPKEGENWASNGRDVVQSDFGFRWRIRILRRDAYDSTSYFQEDDYFVMSPAEAISKDSNGSLYRYIIPSAEWEVNMEGLLEIDGNDLHIWKYGVNSKYRIRDLNNKTFRVQMTDYQESKEGKYWDVEGRSVASGAKIHVWKGKDADDDASQRFYLVEDNDGDPETFYVKNMNSGKYLIPEGFFSGLEIGAEGYNWKGIKIVQSNFAYRWRFHVLNREVPGTSTYTNWMEKIDDSVYLSQMNIPGTHDSCTANVEGGDVSSQNNVACQKYFIDEQLIAGVRAFDLRTNENNDSGTFVMIHGYEQYVCHLPGRGGDDSINMTLISVLDEMIEFLKTHKRETIIVTLKIDNDDNDDKLIKRRLANLLLDEYFDNPDNKNYFYQWHALGTSADTIVSPTLGDVRGKIVMLSRVDFSNQMLCYSPYDNEEENSSALDGIDSMLLRTYTGPDLSQWDKKYDDTTYYAQVIYKNEAGVRVWIQDDWQCLNGDKKKHFFNTYDQLNGIFPDRETYLDVGMPDNDDFVFNYTSKTTGNEASPLSASEYMNNFIFNDAGLHNKLKRIGIVMMDFVSKPLAAHIISHNDFYKSPYYHPQTNSNSASTPVMMSAISSAEEQQMLSESSNEIIWPTDASVTYGYILKEATLHFDDPDYENTVAGFYYFENGTDILTVKDDACTEQTLIFESYDGTVKESAQITVMVKPRDLPISVGNYQIEYGDEFDITQTSYPTAGGFFLLSDQEKLNNIVQAAEIHYKAVDEYGNDITITSATKPCKGIILLTANKPDEVRHPNYYTYVKNGTWTIMPRTVNVEWKHSANGWTASIDNIINGDEVFAVVKATSDGKGAILTLGGADSDYYQIAEEDEISPDNPETSDNSMFIVLLTIGILSLCVCVFIVSKKHRLKQL